MLLAGIICSGSSLLVTKSGRSTYVIVVPENSTAQNNRAASLLKRQLQAATGADIPIIYESRRRNRSGIFVGPVKTAANNKSGAAKVPAVFFNKTHIFIGADPETDPQRAVAVCVHERPEEFSLLRFIPFAEVHFHVLAVGFFLDVIDEVIIGFGD